MMVSLPVAEHLMNFHRINFTQWLAHRVLPLGLLGLGLLLGWQTAARGAELASRDAVAVQQVVRSQLDAFAVDDAERAFSFAAADLRKMFGTAQNFLAMVRSSYPMVHRPASVVFLKPELKGADVVQTAQMSDAKGAAWLAIYTLQQQSDKSWRISACVVVANEGRAT